MNQKSKQEKIAKDHEVARDAVCVCKSCHHDFARDCIKGSCTCCKKVEHSMTIDGPEGFTSLSSKAESYYDEYYNKKTEALKNLMQVKGFIKDVKFEK